MQLEILPEALRLCYQTRAFVYRGTQATVTSEYDDFTALCWLCWVLSL